MSAEEAENTFLGFAKSREGPGGGAVARASTEEVGLGTHKGCPCGGMVGWREVTRGPGDLRMYVRAGHGLVVSKGMERYVFALGGKRLRRHWR